MTAPPPSPTGLYWRAGAVLVAAILAYSNSLTGPFLSDDDPSAFAFPIRSWADLRHIILPMRESPFAGRPVVSVSFALNYAWGGLEVGGYHIVNIAIHACCALLLLLILEQTLGLPRMRARWATRALDVALAVALLWGVHPLNTEAVDYLSQRAESLMALCLLLTLYASMRGRSGSTAWQWLAVCVCGAGMACKESMVAAPLLVGLYDRVFVYQSWGEAWRARRRLYAGLGATWSILAALVATGPRKYSTGFSAGVSVWTYVLNQAVMLARYLRLVVWPRNLVLLYGPPVPLGLRDVLAPAVVIVAILVAIGFLLVRRPPLGFLGAWVVLTLAPTSSLVPIATEVGAERRMYLPLMAVLTAMVVGVCLAWDNLQTHLPTRARDGRLLSATALLLLASVLTVATLQRNDEYRSALVMAQTILARWPTGAAHYSLGRELEQLGRQREAATEYRQAAASFPRARFYWGRALYVAGQRDDAIHELQQFVTDEPLLAEVVPAHLMIGHALEEERRWDDAIAQLRLVLAINPQTVEAHAFLAEALVGKGALPEAISEFQLYLQKRPGDLGTLTDLGLALVDHGDVELAVSIFRRAVMLAPRDGAVHANLARTLLLHGDVSEAAQEAQTAVTLAPSDATNHELLGRLQATRGQLQQAELELDRALAIDPQNADAREDLRAIARIAPSAR